MYHISYDFEEPYNVFGGLQDNGSWMTPHRIQGGSAIQNKDWNPTGWGDGFAIVRDRADKDIIYFESQGGSAIRRHLHSGETKPISPFEELGEKNCDSIGMLQLFNLQSMLKRFILVHNIFIDHIIMVIHGKEFLLT